MNSARFISIGYCNKWYYCWVNCVGHTLCQIMYHYQIMYHQAIYYCVGIHDELKKFTRMTDYLSLSWASILNWRFQFRKVILSPFQFRLCQYMRPLQYFSQHMLYSICSPFLQFGEIILEAYQYSVDMTILNAGVIFSFIIQLFTPLPCLVMNKIKYTFLWYNGPNPAW